MINLNDYDIGTMFNYGNSNDNGRTISTKYYSHPTQCITKSKISKIVT